MEIELKLLIAAKHVRALRAHPLLKRYAVAPPHQAFVLVIAAAQHRRLYAQAYAFELGLAGEEQGEALACQRLGLEAEHRRKTRVHPAQHALMRQRQPQRAQAREGIGWGKPGRSFGAYGGIHGCVG